MTELVHVPFHGGDVLAAEIDGKTYVVLKPVIESLGLDFSGQLQKLRRQPWACVVVTPMQVPGDVQTRDYVTVDVRTLLMLLAQVQVSRVAEHLRPMLALYQAEVADVLEAHFAGPRVFEIPKDLSSALRLAADEHDARVQAEAKLAIAQEGADKFQMMGGGQGLSLRAFNKKYFSDVAEGVFFAHLYSHGLLIDQLGKGTWSEKRQQYRDGSQHRHPTFKSRQYLYLHSAPDRNEVRRESTRVRPGEPELAFRDLLAKQGLMPNQHMMSTALVSR